MSKRERRDTFMDVYVTDKQYWIELDSSNGIFYIPDMRLPTRHDVKDCQYGKFKSEHILWYLKDCYHDLYEHASELYGAREVRGYGVRLSAAGYMDCTEWEVYTNKREAMRRARELDQENQEANNPDF